MPMRTDGHPRPYPLRLGTNQETNQIQASASKIRIKSIINQFKNQYGNVVSELVHRIICILSPSCEHIVGSGERQPQQGIVMQHLRESEKTLECCFASRKKTRDPMFGELERPVHLNSQHDASGCGRRHFGCFCFSRRNLLL